MSASVWLGAAVLTAAPVATTLTNSEHRELQREARLVVDILQNYHYADRQFYELDAAEIIDRYLRELDPRALILTAGEVDFMRRRFSRTLKTVYLLKGDVQPAYEMFDVFSERIRARLRWIEDWLAQPHDPEADGSLALDGDDKPEWAADKSIADERWAARLRHAIVSEVLRGRTEAEAITEVAESHRRWGKQIAALDATAVRAHFLDGLIGLFDPHSGYFSAENAEEFETDMRGTVAGAGLDVRMEEGRCLVTSVLPGGPAEAAGGFSPGDQLMAVAEGEGEWTDLTGKRLNDIVARLRGEVGSVVRVAFRHAIESERQEVKLTRASVQLIEGRARGAIFSVPHEQGPMRRIGWIDIPAFYADASGAGMSSVSKDVRELLLEMKTGPGVEGLVIDLRRNPGGAMTEAEALVGLFVPGGAVLLTRGIDGRTEVKLAPDGAPVFDGPLVVLTSRGSASASEIFAGAMQFHHRGLVVGAKTTFGKGTVQAYLNLNQNPMRGAGAKLPWGTLRLTSQRFYFPDGRSPQINGAASDLILPLGEEKTGETEQDLPHALPSETIAMPAGVKSIEVGARMDEALKAKLAAAMHERAARLAEFSLENHRREMNERSRAKKTAELKLSARRSQHAEEDAARHAWTAERCRVVGEIAFAREAVETSAVRQVIDVHRERVLGRRGGTPPEGQGWLQAGLFYRVNAAGELREISVGAIPFARFAPQAGVLAAAYTSATGITFTEEQMNAALLRLARIESGGQADFVNAFAIDAAEGAIDEARLQPGAEAVLHAMTDEEPALLDPQYAWDVPARESLRLAADWAAWRDAGATGNPAPSHP